jgi:uncharacterized protein
MPTITALYAGLLGLLAFAVAFPAGRIRGQLGVSCGDGGNPALLLAMRRHANFVEWVPLGLILIALLELNGVDSVPVHALGGLLLLSRILHAVGIRAETMKSMPRLIGAAGTVLVIVVASVWLIVVHFHR